MRTPLWAIAEASPPLALQQPQQRHRRRRPHRPPLVGPTDKRGWVGKLTPAAAVEALLCFQVAHRRRLCLRSPRLGAPSHPQVRPSGPSPSTQLTRPPTPTQGIHLRKLGCTPSLYRRGRWRSMADTLGTKTRGPTRRYD